MYDITTPLKKTLSQSSFADLKGWLSYHPNDAAWYLISDYCIGDMGKKNDVVSFTVLLNHDTMGNIKSFIKKHAPKDIKSTRKVSPTFLEYMNSPFMYHFTFMIPRKLKFMKPVITTQKMREFLPKFKELVFEVDALSTFKPGYIEAVVKRLDSFLHDFEMPQFNAKLARQEFLISTLAAVIIDTLVSLKSPSHIAWLSDRDAITQRYDGFIFDFAVFMFLLLHSDSTDTSKPENRILHKPQFHFCTHDNSGKTYVDEFIRIPDYLAGTLADFNSSNGAFSKEKYRTIYETSLVNSGNHSVIQISFERDEIYTRRLKFA